MDKKQLRTQRQRSRWPTKGKKGDQRNLKPHYKENCLAKQNKQRSMAGYPLPQRGRKTNLKKQGKKKRS